MKQWIRWPGAVVFLVLSALCVAFAMFAANPIVRYVIEDQGSKANGAKIEVQDVGLSLFPLGLHLQGLAVTDAKNTMQNAVWMDDIHAKLEVAPLFVGKFIISELGVTGMAFNTPRKESGALPVEEKASGDAAATEKKDDEPFISKKDLPSADEIMARETLLTIERGKAFKNTLSTRKDEIKTATDQLPNDQSLAAYKRKINALTSGRLTSVDDFVQRKKALDQLKADFERDRAAIASARQVIQQSQKDIKQQLAELKRAPGDDLTRLKSTYTLDAGGISAVSGLLFGSEVKYWTRQALYWYERIKPFLPKPSTEEEEPAQPIIPNRYVHFPTNNPWPDFLIRSLDVSASVPAGNFAITLLDVTHQQNVLGRPMRVSLNGDDLSSVQSLSMDGSIDWRSEASQSSINLAAKDWRLDNQSVADGRLSMNNALAQVKGVAVFTKDVLQSDINIRVSNAKLATSGSDRLSKELGRALASISSFNLDANIKGKPSKPDVSVSSDLDRRLSAAFTARLKQQQQKLTCEIKARLNAKVAEYAGDHAKQLNKWLAQDQSLEQKMKEIKQLAGTKLESFAEQQKREAKEKADAEKARLEAKKKAEIDKLNAKKEAERKRLEQKKREEEERAKKKAANKAKEAFKGLF